MNAFEKTSKVGRDLFEINADTLRKITELSAENFKKYLELNQEYMQKLPEVRELGAFVELQREYGQNLWQGIQQDVKARGEILRTAVEQTGTVIKGVFSAEESAEEAVAA
jgi:hypothetical protein